MRKLKPTLSEVALADAEAVNRSAPPRTQAEWRTVSTALRTALRSHQTAYPKVGRTFRVSCGSSHRYLYADRTVRPGVAVYNGGGGAAYDLIMLAWYRRRYRECGAAAYLYDFRSHLFHLRGKRETRIAA